MARVLFRDRNRISSEQLAEYGRRSFIKFWWGFPKDEPEFTLVAPLEAAIWSGPGGRASVIAELRRHAAAGAWEKVGAWKFAIWFLERGEGTRDLIDAGLLTVAQMGVTNLRQHLNKLEDAPRYRELTGRDIPQCHGDKDETRSGPGSSLLP